MRREGSTKPPEREERSLLPAIAPYVPPGLARAVLAEPALPAGPTARRFPAAVLFADIEGFTPLTEAFAEQGTAGAEELTHLLNRVFGRMIALVEAEGGEVVQFGGDALTVLFPAGEEPPGYAVRRAQQAAQAMQQAVDAFSTLATSVGQVTLGIKIGIGVGEAVAVQVGGIDDVWTYAVGGAPLRRAAATQQRLGRGEIGLTPQAEATIHSAALPPTPLVHPDWAALSDPWAVESVLRCYVPSVVQAWLEEGLHDWLSVLRPMSVLFVGLDGLDETQPGAVALLQKLLRATQERLGHYQGVLRQLAIDDKGIVLILLFGAPPYAHEDDPLRAVRCALDLQEMASLVEAEGVRLSIGAASGWVFAGPIGTETRRDYTVLGDAVNLAARLMEAAEGGILSDFDTYQQARTRMAFKSLPPIRLKGKGGLIRVYRPLAAVRRRREEAASEKAMVGRQLEMERIDGLLQTLEDQGRGRVLIVEGDAGIGKSRLVDELTDLLRQRGLAWLLGAGQSIERQTPYRAWRDIFAYYFGLDEASEPERRRHRVETLLAELAPEQIERLPLLNDLLHLDLPETELTAAMEPALRQQSLADLLLSLLRSWMRERPLVLVLEDAQWLDSLSWELATYVARGAMLSADPLLLVVVSRPLEEGAAGWQPMNTLRSLSRTEVLRLTTLHPKEVASLVAARLGVREAGLPRRLAELVQRRAEGNPFFAEELVLTLREEGLLNVTGDPPRCVVGGDLARTARTLPGTVQGLILARIDRLSPPRQFALKVGAVIGRIFPYRTLRYALSRHTTVTDAELRVHLDALANLDLTPVDTPEPELTYLFKHIITREVAYGTLLYAQRRALHRTVAEWYERLVGVGPAGGQGRIPLLAHHYRQAGDEEKERYYARLAGMQAAARFANAEALAYLSRALELTPQGRAAERYDLLLAREAVYDRLGDRESQRGDLEVLEELAAQLKEPRRRSEVTLRRARYALALSDYPAAVASAQRAVQIARTADLLALEAEGYTAWGHALWRQADYEAAEDVLQQGLSLAQEARLHRTEADILRNLGAIPYYLGEYERARDYFARAYRVFSELGDRVAAAAALNNLALVANNTGDYSQAVANFERALQMMREVGHRWGESLALNNLGLALTNQGLYTRAMEYYRKSLPACREIGNRWGEGLALYNLGLICDYQGDYGGAGGFLEQALQITREIGDRMFEGSVLSTLGLLAHHRGDDHLGWEYSRRALEIGREVGDRRGQAYALTHLGHTLHGLGRHEEAEAAYREGLAIRTDLEEHSLAMETRAGLARVVLDRGDLDAAKALVDEILRFLERGSLAGVDEPARVHLTCYRVLQAAGDRRASQVLHRVYSLLQQRAAAIEDPAMRRSFLQEVPAHREIRQAFDRWERDVASVPR